MHVESVGPVSQTFRSNKIIPEDVLCLTDLSYRNLYHLADRNGTFLFNQIVSFSQKVAFFIQDKKL